MAVVAGRNVGLQALEKRGDLHGRWDFADPHVHAGGEIVEMSLDSEARVFQEVGGEKPRHGLHDPGVGLGIAIAEANLDDLMLFVRLHRRDLGLSVQPQSSKSCDTWK